MSPMKLLTVDLQDAWGRLGDVLDAAQTDRVVLTRDGRPVAVLVGVEGSDMEDLELGMDEDLWRTIAERRASKLPTVPFAQALGCRYGMAASLNLVDPCPKCTLTRERARAIDPPYSGPFEGPWLRVVREEGVSGEVRPRCGPPVAGATYRRLKPGQLVLAAADLFTIGYEGRVAKGTPGHVQRTDVYDCPMLVSVQWDGWSDPPPVPNPVSVSDLEPC